MIQLFDSDPDRPPTPLEESLLQDIRKRRRMYWMAILIGMPILLLAKALLPGPAVTVLAAGFVLVVMVLESLADFSRCPRCGNRLNTWRRTCSCGLSFDHRVDGDNR